jgi:hypothetical protein
LQVTLETYLLQHHIWLTSNAKTLLRLIPQEDWRACNMLVTTCVYFVCSRELYRLTMSLRGMLLPDHSAKDCLRNLGGFFAVLAGSWAVGVAVRLGVGASPAAAAPVVALLSLGGGVALASVLVTRLSYKSHSESDDESAEDPLLEPAKPAPGDKASSAGKEGAGSGGADSAHGVPPHSVFVAGGVKSVTFKVACATTVSVVLFTYLVMSLYFERHPAAHTLSAQAAAAAPAKAATPRQPGEMAQPLLGLGILVASLIMLASMDSYFGFPMLALKLFGGGGKDAQVGYDAAYGRLLSRLGLGAALPSTNVPAAPVSSGEGVSELELPALGAKNGVGH